MVVAPETPAPSSETASSIDDIFRYHSRESRRSFSAGSSTSLKTLCTPIKHWAELAAAAAAPIGTSTALTPAVKGTATVPLNTTLQPNQALTQATEALNASAITRDSRGLFRN
ncbi:hypothetical protein D3C76_1334830 [compost metagenome]